MNKSEKTRQELLNRIKELIKQEDFEQLRKVLADSRSSDVAEVVEVLDEIARQLLFDLMDPKDAGEVLEKIDDATRSEVVEELTGEELGDIVSTLPPDEAADVVADLSPEQSEEVLEHIPDEESAQIEQLLRYDEDTAGGIMTTDVMTVNVNDTVGDVIKRFRESNPEEDYYHIFVVDDEGKLKGSVSVHNLLRYPEETPVMDILDEELPRVGVNADQEEIANTFRKNDLIAMPVVDENGVLLGRITADDVIDVINEEAEEDALVMAGTHPDELDTKRALKAATIRLPWLLTCLMGTMISATIFYFFGHHFSKAQWLSITMFVPAIASMGGNTGLQTSTIVVRGLATGDLAALKLFQIFIRESSIAVIVAAVCAVLAGTFAIITLHFRAPALNLDLDQAPVLGLTVGLAMFCGIMLATSLGIVLPFIFKHFGIDPAISSGPLVTTTNDMVTYTTYFSMALLLLYLFGY